MMNSVHMSRRGWRVRHPSLIHYSLQGQAYAARIRFPMHRFHAALFQHRRVRVYRNSHHRKPRFNAHDVVPTPKRSEDPAGPLKRRSPSGPSDAYSAALRKMEPHDRARQSNSVGSKVEKVVETGPEARRVPRQGMGRAEEGPDVHDAIISIHVAFWGHFGVE